MKKVEAIVRPEKIDSIRAALEKAGYPGMTITEVQGHGKQKGVTQQWRGESYTVNLLPKVKLEIVVHDADVEKIVQAIAATAKTNGGAVGDGKIFVTTVQEVLRIRTGERGDAAV